MKIIEGIQLKNTIKQIRKYQSEHKGFDNLYRELDSLNINSLQSFSFQNDSDFFDEVSFVLSVINSIIAHPHIITKSEDIVIRAELAGHIEHDQFQKVMRESSLWKQKEFDMVPEYVYHHQHLDELKIYENIFIGMLIKLLDQEINKYYDFYVSILPSIDNSYEIVLENESIEISEYVIPEAISLLRSSLYPPIVPIITISPSFIHFSIFFILAVKKLIFCLNSRKMSLEDFSRRSL